MAVVSDAGTPGISDPGFLVAREAVKAGVEVVCLPGPTAFVPALVASGIPCDRFCFEGFLPVKKGRATRLAALAAEERTLVFYESPHRVVKTLAQLAETFGAGRQAAVCREISKVHEGACAARSRNWPPISRRRSRGESSSSWWPGATRRRARRKIRTNKRIEAMKKVFLCAMCAAALAACTNGPSKKEQALTEERDSLMQVISDKDTELNEIMGTVNEVQEGFRRINEAEGRITVTDAGVESEAAKQSIRENMQFIQDAMAQNREKIKQLQEKLRTSSVGGGS